MKLAISIICLIACFVLASLYFSFDPKQENRLFSLNEKFSDTYYSVSCQGEKGKLTCDFPDIPEHLVKLFCEVNNCSVKDKKRYLSSNRFETLLKLSRAEQENLTNVRLCDPFYGTYEENGIELAISFNAFAARVKESYRMEILHVMDFYYRESDRSWFVAGHNEPPRSFCSHDDNAKIADFIDTISRR
ncbi:hypothetical protein [Roseovarius aestuarii]|uniref:Uncharacterized protein n=1 Tax=Roseovarius aestuarii TaxID=475083 RepID=A0A1X7BYQ7_9RHOB|nr:hypothetical protein [Roseovarius aestuarii]SMC14712.1 hypothetical protein ROA7745_04582 [Roseovarius aestuarii]